MARTFIGLGSNLGDRLAFLRSAVAHLGELPGTRVVATSQIYETAPVGPVADQPSFLNAACELETALAPRTLLDRLLGIEAELGRVRRVAQGPRVIDLDLLLYERRVVDEPGLQVPHPRLAERAFVVVPLCDLAPDLAHPVTGVVLRALLEGLRDQELCPYAAAAALR